MRIFTSLRNRIFVTSALLAVLSIAAAIFLVNLRVTSELEAQLQREIVANGKLVEQLRSARAEQFTTLARLIADAPKLKAATDTNDPPTVQATLDDYQRQYQRQLGSAMLFVTNRSGEILATAGAPPRLAAVVVNLPSTRDAMAGRESVALLPQPDGILQLATLPITVGVHADILGTLSVGFLFDAAVAAQLKDITASDIAFGVNGDVVATTLPADDRAALRSLLDRADRSGNLTLETGEYVSLPLALAPPQDGRAAGDARTGPVALVLRSRSQQLHVLGQIRRELGITAVVAVLLATLLSFAVARTMTRPLAAITGKMREIAATGDLTRKIVLPTGQQWDDADARLVATTFNVLTDSIAQFQREVSQKERLSSLGRLSTVIAHEIRNPLMIIKTALHALRQPGLSSATLREAAADIDGEIVRLNRIVNDVLDFARPIKFELAAADLNAICRESAAAASADDGPPVVTDLDASVPSIATDAERLRIALVNLIVNARQAATPDTVGTPADGRTSADGPNARAPRVVVSTRATPEGVGVTITDNGHGIDHEALPRVFDPYFTTKRGGTGLGLPIARNVVEGLGGTIAVETVPGRGTEVRIEFPRAAVTVPASRIH